MDFDAPTPGERRRRGTLAHDRIVQLLALAGGAPAVVVALLWVWRSGSEETRWTSTALLLGAWLLGALLVRAQVVRPLHALANMLAALRAGDYSLRARRGEPDQPLGLVLHELNALSGLLFEQRLGALEAGALLRHVIANVDVAVFAFDDAARLRLVNPEGQRLLAAPAERLLGRTAQELGLGDLAGPAADEGDARPSATVSRVASLELPGGNGRFEVRRGGFRQGGRPHILLLVTDLSAALRAEERQAWQRLVRVMSHEINNSLAPIKSIAGSLQRRLTSGRSRIDLPREVAADGPTSSAPSLTSTPVVGTPAADAYAAGLGVIAERAESLSRFIGAYARLSRLPPPRPRAVDVAAIARRVVALETRLPVRLTGEGSAWVRADPDQLEQLLINLVRNAVDAALETDGGVEIRWDANAPAGVRVFVEDEGPGVAESSNLFVPFYSTKPDGSGIGLALSRQIADAHGGTLTLANRPDRRGARAELTLPR